MTKTCGLPAHIFNSVLFCILMQIFACYSGWAISVPLFYWYISSSVRDLSSFYVVARDVSKTKNACKFLSLCFALFSKVRYYTLLSIFNAYTVENYYRTKTTEHCRKVPISKIQTTDNSKKIWRSLILRIIEVWLYLKVSFWSQTIHFEI